MMEVKEATACPANSKQPVVVGCTSDYSQEEFSEVSTSGSSVNGTSQHPIAQLVEGFVKEQLRNIPRDGSHDWWHIERVRSLAMMLALEENLQGESLLIVELAALLHDVGDWKYSQTEASAPTAKDCLASVPVNESVKTTVLDIIDRMGFKDELGSSSSNVSREFGVVQDADRLDAMGAVGIARCFTFGGKFNRVLHDPAIPPRQNLTTASYKTGEQTTINHFYEKLLKLKDLMKTKAGRRRAEQRHEFLLTFLRQFDREWQGLL